MSCHTERTGIQIADPHHNAAECDQRTGRETEFFRAQQQLSVLGTYSDEELSRFNTARRYQLAQQCLYLAAARPEEARALVKRLGAEFVAWFDYMLERKQLL